MRRPTGPRLAELLEAAGGDGRNPHVDTSSPLLIVYTSGTTGRPKGAVLRQEALVWNAVMSQHMHDMTATDHMLTVLPMFHVGGLNIQTTPALQLGATVTLHARFAPEVTLEAIERERPTLTVLVPATIQAMLEHPRWEATRLDSLRAVTTGSTQVPQRLVDAIVQRGVPVLQVYGATETCPVSVYTRLSGDWRRPGSTGLPGLVCEAKIVDAACNEVAPGTPGEVVVRGPNVFFEYWGNAQATAETLREGWYHSGDLGTRDADGHFFIHDRKKNLIVSGGENIYPAEVERVLYAHPAVAEAAVIGRSDARWQEVPIAYVVPRAGATATPAETREASASEQLARYKVPREFVFVDSLPRNALGKVQHFRLKELVAQGAAALGRAGLCGRAGGSVETASRAVEMVRPVTWHFAGVWAPSHVDACPALRSHGPWLWRALTRTVAQNRSQTWEEAVMPNPSRLRGSGVPQQAWSLSPPYWWRCSPHRRWPRSRSRSASPWR